MKKNDWFILLATFAYTFLFYEQTAGLNFLLFNMVLLTLLLLRDRTLVAKPAWLAAAIGSIVSAVFVFVYGTWLPILANICSLMMLEAFSFKPESSLLIALANSVFTVLVSLPFAIQRAFTKGKDNETEPGILRKLPLLVLPLFVTTIFFFVYRAANPIFEKYTSSIDADFISFDWICFTFVGLLLMLGFFSHHVIDWLMQQDAGANDALTNITLDEHLLTKRFFTVTNEVLSGVILFSLLNLLLLSVNSLDIYFMWIVRQIPESVSVAEYLHNGTNTLILSICMAIAVILFVFRGYLNFFKSNKLLKFLAYGWIAQNILLVITTAHRTWWIIESSGLTRRRIGIYVYLTLCIIGLSTTFIKVMQKKSNWFLFRKNSWAFYGVFIVSCMVNWDNFIVRYNCNHFKTLEFEYIDREYQADLSYTSLASLFEYYNLEKGDKNANQKIFTEQILRTMYDRYEKLQQETKNQSWKSYCVSKTQSVKAIGEMIAKNK